MECNQLAQNQSAPVPPAKPLTHPALELLAAALQRQRKQTKQRPYAGVFADWAVCEASGVLPSGHTSFLWTFVYSLL